MTDPTQPNEPVPPDPTRQMPAATPPPTPARTTTTTTTTSQGPPPRPGGLSGGAAAVIALGAAALALLIGFLVWGQDDDADGADLATDPDTTQVENSAPEDTTPEETGEVDDLRGQVDDLESQLGDVTSERDDLQSRLDEAEAGRVELDDLVGMSIGEVRDLASENGWELVEQAPEDADEDTETDVVLSQSPESGTTMIEGSLLLVEVATG